MVGSCECGTEPMGSLKIREFLDRMTVGSEGTTLLNGLDEWVTSVRYEN